MKAVILAAGRGKRLKEQTEPANKSMLMFKGRHLIEYSLETAKLCNVDEIIIVVGYRATDIVNKFGIQYKNIKIRYVIQEEQKGLVNALEYTRDALEGDPVRRNLHNGVPHPRVEHPAQDPLHLCRLGRGVDGRTAFDARHHFRRGHEAAAFDAVCAGEDAVQGVGGRGLAIGAGDAVHSHARRGVAVDGARDRGERRAGVGDNNDGGVSGRAGDRAL